MNDQLEQLIDQHGLVRVMEIIAGICYEKAIHVETNWQDKVLAGEWESNGNAIDSLAPSLTDLP